ncbi:MAG: hypothetical protein J3K34DRAFT_27493 [Monoraphidium minutum]|nr:MAG: hypothetical protein J3K34DRAFT_27493 [Monoraphidium minutum]
MSCDEGAASEAAGVVAALLDAGAVSSLSVDVSLAPQLVACCIACLPAPAAPGACGSCGAARHNGALAWPGGGGCGGGPPEGAAGRAVVAARLARALVGLHPAFAAALLGLEGLPRLVGAAGAPPGGAPLALVAEAMALLDALSLGNREELAKASAVDAIVGVLRLPRGGGPPAPGDGGGAAARAALALRAKACACNLITVLAFGAAVKRELFHKHAVGPLMVFAEEVGGAWVARGWCVPCV